MTPAAILSLIEAGITVLPQLWDLYKQASAGTPVSADQVSAVLAQYGVDRLQAGKDLAALEAEAKPVGAGG